MTESTANNMQQAGTGFMGSSSEAIKELQKRGYTEDFSPKFDHLEAHSGQEKIRPDEFEVDEILRFENTSDPNDQSILYAISCPARGLKGTYLESYGLYQNDYSPAMLDRLSRHLH
ncbi:MAG: phosphoribosylpyrophosphate synthetase [Bdellovibrionota bacterium]